MFLSRLSIFNGFQRGENVRAEPIDYMPASVKHLKEFATLSADIIKFEVNLDQDNQAKTIMNFSRALYEMPPAFQTFFLQNTPDVKICDLAGDAGEWFRGELAIDPQSRYGIKGISRIFYHELGHQIDEYCFDFLKPGELNIMGPGIKNRRVESPVGIAMRAELKSRGFDFDKMSSRENGISALKGVFGKKVFDSSMNIETFLVFVGHNSLDAATGHYSETFAEMIANYLMVYARERGNESAVRRILADKYPILYPAFERHVINKLSDQTEARRQKLELFSKRYLT